MNEQGGNYCQNNKTSVRHNLRHKSAVAAGDSAPHPLYSTNSSAPECCTPTFISSVEYCTCTVYIYLITKVLPIHYVPVRYGTVQGMHVPLHQHMHAYSCVSSLECCTFISLPGKCTYISPGHINSYLITMVLVGGGGGIFLHKREG